MTIRNSFILLLCFILISCEEKNSHDNDSTVQPADTTQQLSYNLSQQDADNLVKKLQGKWQEAEYPFRVVYFELTKVKFIEEGIAEKPVFRDFEILTNCPFQVNNIKKAKAGDLFLVVNSNKTCEKINISGDSLRLSGFNMSTNSDYNIIYKKAG